MDCFGDGGLWPPSHVLGMGPLAPFSNIVTLYLQYADSA